MSQFVSGLSQGLCPCRRALVCLLLAAGVGCGQSQLMSVQGDGPDHQLGRVLLALPDVDGDGRSDWASGAPLSTVGTGPLTGQVELRSGADGALILTITGDQAGQRFGAALTVADVSGDGSPELLIAAPLHTGSAGIAAGRVTAHSLSTGAAVLVVNGGSAGERFGTALATLQDLNGDGATEWACGAPLFDGVVGPNTGRVTVHDGSSGTVMAAFEGEGANDELGRALSPTGDMNGDLVTDLVAGAPRRDGPMGPDYGRAYLLTPFLGLLATADGAGPDERFGAQVSGAGDLNGDGIRDVLVAADRAPAAAGPTAGRVDALSGPTLTSVIWSTSGTQAGERFGAALTTVGDMDGDGAPELAVGAPLWDGAPGFDAGRVALLAPDTGAPLFSIPGPADFAQYGFSVAAGGDFDFDGRPDLLAGAPFAAGPAGSQAGLVTAVTLDPPLGRQVDTYTVGALPQRVAAADADGDGDLDLAVLCAGSMEVRVLWNGDHSHSGPSHGPGVFDVIPQSAVPLLAGAPVTDVAMAQLDGDPIAELVVSRQDGTVEIVDGSGTTMAPSFAPPTGTITADPRPTPGAVSALAVVDAGPTARVVAALSGTAFAPGQLRVISDPLGTATVGAPIAEGGSFSAIQATDLDGDGHEDLIAPNSATPPAGGVHVLLGPNWAAATGSPFFVSALPIDARPAALDADGVVNDVLVAELGFLGGGAGVLSDFTPGAGFALASPSPSPPAARSICSWNPGPTTRGAAFVDGLGDLSLLESWNGSAFNSSTPFPVGQGIAHIVCAQLTAFDAASLCNGEELVAAVRPDHAVRVIRQGVPHVATPIAGTGCPGGPTLALSGAPTLGNSTFAVQLNGATPGVLAELALEPVFSPGASIPVFAVGPCGFASLSLDWTFIPFTTDPFGSVDWSILIPNNPAYLCIDYLGTWVVHDGGPVLGLTLSPTWRVRIGEF